MRGSSFGYLVRQGIIGTWLNRMMSIASVGILTACLIIVGGSGLLAVNIRDLFTSIENQNEVVLQKVRLAIQLLKQKVVE